MRKSRDYHIMDPTWCRGCGIYGVYSSLKKVTASFDLAPEQIVMVTGIGCHGRLNNYFRAYGFHALHGRVLPVASGVKLSNPDLSVISISGDGDAYSIGMSHFIHSLKRNINLVYLVVDNRVYALTQGQTSPTSPKGYVSRSTPYGSPSIPLDGAKIALASGGTFIARGFSGQPKHLASLIKQAINHNGFSFIEVLSPCVTHNKVNTYEWFRNNIFNVDSKKDYNPKNKTKAWDIINNESKIPVGLIYVEKRPTLEDISLPGKVPLVKSDLSVDRKRLDKILDEFA